MAVVQVNENTLDFIFDESVNNYTLQGGTILLNINSNTKVYYYDNNNSLKQVNAVMYNDTTIGFGYLEQFGVRDNTFVIGTFAVWKVESPVVLEGISADKDKWYGPSDVGIEEIKGFRIENFTYAEGQTLETINTLVNPYIGTKTSFAKTYTLRVNGKLLNTINGKKIRNLIYNGTTYEIAEPVASGYTLTLDYENSNDIKYTTNTGETGSFSGIGTITLNNVESITFEGKRSPDFFAPEYGYCLVGSTKGGSEYGVVGVFAGDTPLTLDITEDKTIYLYGSLKLPPPDIPMP